MIEEDASQKAIDAKDIWRMFRKMIDHENELINHRFTWMLTAQSLLFAALGVFWGKEKFVEILICIVGLSSCVFIGYSLFLAHKAVEEFDQKWEDSSRTYTQIQLPPMKASEVKTIKWFLPWLCLPMLLVVIWLLIIVFILLCQRSEDCIKYFV